MYLIHNNYKSLYINSTSTYFIMLLKYLVSLIRKSVAYKQVK